MHQFAVATETLWFGNQCVPRIDTVDHKSIIIKLSSTFAPRVRGENGWVCLDLDCGGANCKSLECEACKGRLVLMLRVARGDLFTDGDSNRL